MLVLVPYGHGSTKTSESESCGPFRISKKASYDKQAKRKKFRRAMILYQQFASLNFWPNFHLWNWFHYSHNNKLTSLVYLLTLQDIYFILHCEVLYEHRDWSSHIELTQNTKRWCSVRKTLLIFNTETRAKDLSILVLHNHKQKFTQRANIIQRDGKNHNKKNNLISKNDFLMARPHIVYDFSISN